MLINLIEEEKGTEDNNRVSVGKEATHYFIVVIWKTLLRRKERCKLKYGLDSVYPLRLNIEISNIFSFINIKIFS